MYTWAEHTGELELHVEAASEEQVFRDAAAALSELVRSDDRAGEPARREIALEAHDPATLLADWLAELVFLADARGFVAEHVAALELGDGHLRAVVEGRIGEPAPLVKAVTYHGLRLDQEGEIWRACVVLDV